MASTRDGDGLHDATRGYQVPKLLLDLRRSLAHPAKLAVQIREGALQLPFELFKCVVDGLRLQDSSLQFIEQPLFESVRECLHPVRA